MMKKAFFRSDDERIKTLGRHTYYEGMPAFCWPNSGFCFSFRGSGITLSFAPFETPYTHYLLVRVDRMSQRFPISTGNEKIIIEGLDNKRHSVEVLKVTEGESVDERIVFTGMEIQGVTPELFPVPPKNSKLKIEFVGDSLTAGYGNLGTAEDKVFHTYQEDSTRAYAYVCAELLDAEAHFVCYSGKGVFCNCRGEKNYEIPIFFNHASRVTREPWDFSKWTPDAVVVNAGTNDFAGGVRGEDFTNAVVDFVNQIRETYPDAYIFWVYGMMQVSAFPYLEEAFARIEDKKCFFHKLKPWQEFKDEQGANGHPNAKSARRQAKVVAKFIKQKMKI
ncbi:MAG: hypothetical protein IKK83_06880 [Clostridia bacterium]|nr:hypothetical protein [Clostridia bacterium]